VRVVGESVGVVVASHPIANDLAPINPNTGTPYFTMKKEGWGSGWAAGNLVRLNTVGAGAGFSLVRACSRAITPSWTTALPSWPAWTLTAPALAIKK